MHSNAAACTLLVLLVTVASAALDGTNVTDDAERRLPTWSDVKEVQSRATVVIWAPTEVFPACAFAVPPVPGWKR